MLVKMSAVLLPLWFSQPLNVLLPKGIHNKFKTFLKLQKRKKHILKHFRNQFWISTYIFWKTQNMFLFQNVFLLQSLFLFQVCLRLEIIFLFWEVFIFINNTKSGGIGLGQYCTVCYLGRQGNLRSHLGVIEIKVYLRSSKET